MKLKIKITKLNRLINYMFFYVFYSIVHINFFVILYAIQHEKLQNYSFVDGRKIIASFEYLLIS